MARYWCFAANVASRTRTLFCATVASAALAGSVAPATSASPPPAAPPRATTALFAPTVTEIGQSRDGSVTYFAHGYASASAGTASLGGMASGDISFRVGGFCLDSAQVGMEPTGVSGNTTSWSYYLAAVNAALLEDAPAGSCNYTVRLAYSLSLTGAVTVTQMEYTVYLRGRPKQGVPDSALALIP